MVAIKNIALFSAIATLAAAAPVATSTQLVARDEYSVADVEKLFENSLGLEKREAGPALNVILNLLGEVVAFLGQTLSNVLSLDLGAESDSLTNLLIGVNAQVIKLVAALGNLGSLSGLGGLLQKALVNTGLTSVILSLSTTVSTLVARILKNGNGLTPAQKAAFSTLQASLTTLYNTLQTQNLGTSLLSTIQNTINQLGKVL